MSSSGDLAALGASEEERKATRVTTENVLSELFLRFSTKEDRIKGFGGVWTFFKPHGADESAVTSSFRCVRTYEVLETEPPVVNFRTFTEQEPTNGRALKRPQDGVFESGYQRLATDGFFSNTMVLSEIEKLEGLPGCVYWRCVALDAENVVRVAPGLPPKPTEMEQLMAAQYPGWKPEHIAFGVFAFETFIQDGKDRWSMGALYSVDSLQLLSHFCIREHQITLDPDDDINFNNLTASKPRPRLDEDVNSWLDYGSQKGEMAEVVWDDEGEMLKLPKRPAKWLAPDVDSSTHRLFLYEDSMYAYYPLRLPAVESESDNAFNKGARFEMGGICRGNAEFRRLVLRYAPAGYITSLTKEVFRPHGHFDFEKRRCTSMRRSQDLRHSSMKRKSEGQQR